MRRSMLEEIGGWDAGFRHYVEDIDVAYRAAQAGWERWLVPEAVVHHAYAAVIDKRFLSRHTLWHLRGMARFVRKHPERLHVLSLAAARGSTLKDDHGPELRASRLVRVQLPRDECRVDPDLDPPKLPRHPQHHGIRLAGVHRHLATSRSLVRSRAGRTGSLQRADLHLPRPASAAGSTRLPRERTFTCPRAKPFDVVAGVGGLRAHPPVPPTPAVASRSRTGSPAEPVEDVVADRRHLWRSDLHALRDDGVLVHPGRPVPVSRRASTGSASRRPGVLPSIPHTHFIDGFQNRAARRIRVADPLPDEHGRLAARRLSTQSGGFGRTANARSEAPARRLRHRSRWSGSTRARRQRSCRRAPPATPPAHETSATSASPSESATRSQRRSRSSRPAISESDSRGRDRQPVRLVVGVRVEAVGRGRDKVEGERRCDGDRRQRELRRSRASAGR